MPSITSEIFIAAPSDRVWAVLTDFKTYNEWNSFNPTMECDLRPGGRVHFRLVLDIYNPRDVSAYVIHIEDGREILWGAEPLYFESLGKGRHSFLVEPVTMGGVSGTRFTHTETFVGLLAYALPQTFFKSVQNGFDTLCRDLKKRAESCENI